MKTSDPNHRPGAISYRSTSTPALMARRALLRRIRKQELRRLQKMLPRLAHIPSSRRLSEITVVEETIRYIKQLQATLLARLKTGSINGVCQDTSMQQADSSEASHHRVVMVTARNLQLSVTDCSLKEKMEQDRTTAKDCSHGLDEQSKSTE